MHEMSLGGKFNRKWGVRPSSISEGDSRRLLDVRLLNLILGNKESTSHSLLPKMQCVRKR